MRGALQKMKVGSCTNYRIYTDLKLNPGNVNSWLKKRRQQESELQERRKDYELRDAALTSESNSIHYP